MKTLKKGDRGAYVEMLQLGLQRSGYLSGALDGIFGSMTEESVKRFQRNFGLSASGVVADPEWERLYPFIRGYTAYTIRRGDTFWSIARENHTTVRAIMLANPEANAQALQEGQRITVPFGYKVVPNNISYTYALVSLLTDGLVKRYPYISRRSIGKSVMGNELWMMKMGQGSNEVFINASHHANEWITTPLTLAFLESYADAYGNFDKIYGLDAVDLFRNATLYMVPLVNPDGVDLVNGVVQGEYYQSARAIAQDFPAIPFPSGWKANISGVDLNLQYPALWEQAKEVKFGQGFTKPAPRDFVGTAPVTAPESKAVYDFTRSQSFDITISYHTQGREIYFKFLDRVPPMGLEIGQYFEMASGYRLADVPYASSFAGYKDWMIDTFDVPSYTIEAGLGVNPLPLSQFPEIYNENVGIMAYALSVMF